MIRVYNFMIELKQLKDTNGNKIHAHGGGILEYSGIFYWYGEDRRNNNFVSIYASKDLKNWEFRNTILKLNSKQEDNCGYVLGLKNANNTKVNIERPKIVYSNKLQKFVMWAHFENGLDYSEAAICIATCSTIDGDYIYHGHFRPLGFMSRDCSIFSQNDKKYFISASNDNKDLHIYLMSDDCLGILKLVNKIFIGQEREAPALFKLGTKIYILTSGCTGWIPNQCQYSSANSIEGVFTELQNIGDETTFHSQPMFIFKFKDEIIYLGDRRGGDNFKNTEEFDYFKSSYVYTYIYEKQGRLYFGDK